MHQSHSRPITHRQPMIIPIPILILTLPLFHQSFGESAPVGGGGGEWKGSQLHMGFFSLRDCARGFIVAPFDH